MAGGGPACYEYLKAFRENSSIGAFEAPLFTDATVIGEYMSGPYILLNPVAANSRPGYFRPAIVLRIEAVPTNVRMPMDATDTSRYHGGGLIDEVAALVSLSLGMRLRAGAVDREFGLADRGRPIAFQLEPWPESKPITRAPRFPWAIGEHELSSESLFGLDRMDRLTPTEANALIKAARSYQQGLWIGEWEPAQAWLHFVSAIGAVMNFGKSRDATDAELLKFYAPDIAKKIKLAGGEPLIESLAPSLRLLFSSTRKFCDFIVSHLPEPPTRRPPAGFQIAWNPDAIKDMLRVIYGHRSKALHEGTPFPMPMCMPPFTASTSWQAPMELPPGLAATMHQGAWLNSDTPMHLHIFEYVVRASICRWWAGRSLGDDASEQKDNTSTT
ncbi:MAG TPA: hypothetical protein VK669_02045 [Candidatus Limnocylindrales bacterium]|nr:hypothetical protein [Candidatus Limnocylindrales bacterium]